ncbi:MAG: hypothetical protein D4R67_11845 [Bacteroidetes bacterium]|nr:MAG: hypothetical protein D4R67_11845 [Bacteroidota bacterium]
MVLCTGTSRIKFVALSRTLAISLLLLIGTTAEVRSQEMLGAVLGNYAGINAIQLNPASMHGSRLWLDIQLAGADISFQNNYMYLSKQEFIFWDLFKPGFILPSHNEEYGTEVRNFYRYTNSNRKNIFLNLRINGPGAMLIWEDHAFGIHSAVRSVSSIRKLPLDVANFMYLGLNYKPQQNINYTTNKRFGLAQMSWFEVGLSYACKVYARGFDRLDAGLSVRKLFGLTGLYAVVDNLDYEVPDDSTIQFNNLDARYGFSLPVDYNTNGTGSSTDPLIAGGGWGFDLGVTYTRLTRTHQKQYFDRLCEQKYEDYLYRIGLSLIDIGGIRFKHRAQTYAIDNRSSYWENVTHLDFETIDHMMDTISFKFYGDPDAASRDDKFTLWLPSAFSVQFDYHYYQNWYINASLIVPFQFSRISVSRPALLAVTPRYEMRWFGASLPLSLYDWYQPRIGLSLRFYILTVGTEKLGSYLGFSNFNGLDFYFTIKIPFEKGVCRQKTSKSCPAYETFTPL